MSGAAVLVPIKAFGAGKTRLAPVLDQQERELLSRTMAERVLTAAGGLPVYVATDDEDVSAWAMARGASLVWTEGLDLNRSIATGLDAMRRDDHRSLVVAHADLPFADDLASLAWFQGVTLVPDRRDDGTNALCMPATIEFEPMYGPGSFVRHLTQLRSRGVAVRIARRAGLRWDVDVPDDLPGPMPALTVPA